MVYAKQMKDGNVIALDIYYYQPQFAEGSSMVIITKEEYDELMAESRAKIAEKQAENTDE